MQIQNSRRLIEVYKQNITPLYNITAIELMFVPTETTVVDNLQYSLLHCHKLTLTGPSLQQLITPLLQLPVVYLAFSPPHLLPGRFYSCPHMNPFRKLHMCLLREM